MKLWLMKSESAVYSIEDLRRDGITGWEGVRNFEARNYLRSMNIGDQAFFYHSNSKPSGVAGIVEICRSAYPDPTQFDKKKHSL
jgi:predicted RNA-binding protein with PUA-like domain